MKNKYQSININNIKVSKINKQLFRVENYYLFDNCFNILPFQTTDHTKRKKIETASLINLNVLNNKCLY